jgi:hypothetical protein
MVSIDDEEPMGPLRGLADRVDPTAGVDDFYVQIMVAPDDLDCLEYHGDVAAGDNDSAIAAAAKGLHSSSSFP